MHTPHGAKRMAWLGLVLVLFGAMLAIAPHADALVPGSGSWVDRSCAEIVAPTGAVGLGQIADDTARTAPYPDQSGGDSFATLTSDGLTVSYRYLPDPSGTGYVLEFADASARIFGYRIERVSDTRVVSKHGAFQGGQTAGSVSFTEQEFTSLVLCTGALAAAGETEHKVTLCHRTNSVTNPYVVITVDYDASTGALGQGNGDHTIHTGAVFDFDADPAVAYPPPHNGDQWGDIIPPYGAFPGLNWDADGQAIYWGPDETVACVGTPPTTTTTTTTIPGSTTTTTTTIPGSTTTTPGSTTTTIPVTTVPPTTTTSPATAQLQIVKAVDGDAPGNWSFDFTGDLGGFALTSSNGSHLVTGLAPGSYVVAEISSPTAALVGIACDDPDAVVDLVDGEATVTLEAGDDVQCTFTNDFPEVQGDEVEQTPTTTSPTVPDTTVEVLPDVVELTTLPYTGNGTRVLTAVGVALMLLGASLVALGSHRLARHAAV